MKTTLLTLPLFLLSITAFSQTNTSGLAFKLYNQVSFAKLETFALQANFRYNRRLKTELTIVNPNFAVLYKTSKGNSHEFELTDLNIQNTKNEETDSNYTTIISGESVRSSTISLRYEYTPNANHLTYKNASLSLGFGVQPYFYRTSITPHVSTQYPESELFLGNLFYIVPRISYSINNHLSIDVNSPINLLDVYFYSQQIHNPLFSESQKNRTTLTFEGIPNKLSLRFGLAYKI